jgi:multidrug efflux pump subunit AcrA (membrane-fusion protein)
MRTKKLNLICLGVAGAVMLLTACQNEATPAAQSQPDNAAATGGGARAARATARAAAAGTPGAISANPAALPTRAVTAKTTIAVDGELALATPLISAAFESSGQVTAVHVSPGQAVKQGDVLAELDGATLNAALQKAQEALALQQAQIEKSLAPATQTDIDSAKAALSSAYAAYNELKQGPTEHEVEQALRSYNEAKNSLYSTQLGRDRACLRPEGSWDAEAEQLAKQDPECKQADLGVEAAEINLQTSYHQYLDAQKPATQKELSQAWSNVVQAQTNLDTLQNGVIDAQKQVYTVQLEQANVSVERAQRNLAQARLIAPCDCVVQEVKLSVGASSDGGSITLLDNSQVKFSTTNLTEQDVIKLKAGQTATIRLKAFDQTFNGKLSAILPVSSGTQGTLALFTALIDLDPTEAGLRPGMTGQAEINLE